MDEIESQKRTIVKTRRRSFKLFKNESFFDILPFELLKIIVVYLDSFEIVKLFFCCCKALRGVHVVEKFVFDVTMPLIGPSVYRMMRDHGEWIKTLVVYNALRLSDDLGGELFSRLKETETLVLNRCELLGRRSILALEEMKNLVTLNLGILQSSRIAAELLSISKIPNLKKLTITHCGSLTTDFFHSLVQNGLHLELINITGCFNITHDAMKHISSMTSLTTLNISHCPVKERGIEYLTSCTNLRNLIYLQEELLDNVTFVKFSRLTFLESLCLGFCTRIYSENIRKLTELINLQYLDIYHSRIDDDIAGALLSSFLDIRKLNLCNSLVSEEIFQKISNTDISHLNLRNCHINFKICPVCPSIQHLDLSNAKFNLNTMPYLFTCFPSLTELYLDDTNIGDMNIMLLSNLLSQIIVLSLNFTDISELGLNHLLSNSPKLQILNIKGCYKIRSLIPDYSNNTKINYI
eukprot:TRINITY_DN12879_c0_g1_i1.p1 TRINITY_DN12879_c0_g1~~TRINITY_DN12879_c0_g1_i1.p1  ORF type:complete len:466 (+),score=62.77 TRINITY_DN12879_c0_g1_i1:43-1440(+)